MIIPNIAFAYSSQTVLSLELLDVVEGVVDQSETSGSATSYKHDPSLPQSITESNLETEENDGLIVLHVVLLAEVSLNLLLGNGSTLGMNHLNGLSDNRGKSRQTIWRRFSRGFLMNFLTRIVTADSDMIIV